MRNDQADSAHCAAGQRCARHRPACQPVDVTGTTAEPPTVTTAEPTAVTSPSPSQTPAVSAQPTEKPAAKPVKKTKKVVPSVLLSKGDTGTKVRELQHRLRQLAWFSGAITGNYGETTVEAVRGFQAKRGLHATGAVDSTTWTTLLTMSRKPTVAELHNKLTAGPALMKLGVLGRSGARASSATSQIGWYEGRMTGTTLGDRDAVTGFQGRRAIPVTGEVDQRTRDRLVGMTRTPSSDELNNVTPKPKASGLDDRCLTGRALCISKGTN